MNAPPAFFFKLLSYALPFASDSYSEISTVKGGLVISRMLLPLIAGAALFAQNPNANPPPLGVPDLKIFLNLSDTQIQTLVQIQQQQAQAVMPFVQQIRQDQQKLQLLLEGTNPEAGAIGRLVLEIAGFSRQIQQLASNFQQQALNLLQPDQRTKVQTLADVLRLQPAALQAVGLGLLSPPGPAT